MNETTSVIEIQLVCSKCTRWAQFFGANEMAAKLTAKAKGWKFVDHRPVCKKCPG